MVMGANYSSAAGCLNFRILVQYGTTSCAPAYISPIFFFLSCFLAAGVGGRGLDKSVMTVNS